MIEIMAHRGLTEEGLLENSLEALALAIDHGYEVEFDVHMTRDARFFVNHDFTFKGKIISRQRSDDLDYHPPRTEAS